jgi:hypothetical protein
VSKQVIIELREADRRAMHLADEVDGDSILEVLECWVHLFLIWREFIADSIASDVTILIVGRCTCY